MVFAKANEKNEIISAIKQGFSVAIEQYKGGVPKVYGDYRLVSYALFLINEYFPLHYNICSEEGRLMLQFAGGDLDIKPELESKYGQTAALFAKYFRASEK